MPKMVFVLTQGFSSNAISSNNIDNSGTGGKTNDDGNIATGTVTIDADQLNP